jgi:hypothetical protein
MNCPACGQPGDGAFCAACGTPLSGAHCRACRSALPTGARFCTSCGVAVRASPQRLPWIVAGAAVGVLIVVLLLPTLRSEPPRGDAAFAQAPAGTLAAPPLTGSVREQADRLFNRIMQARAEGDSAQMMFFVPMALAAYREAEPLDDDGLYHLSLIETAAGDAAAALATAERVLATTPTHLLALAAAAEAALAAGNADAAQRYYQRYLEAYDGERDRQLAEYIDHARILPEYRETAERHVRGR